VPAGTGTCGPFDLAVLEAQVLLAVPEERLDAQRIEYVRIRCVVGAPILFHRISEFMSNAAYR
jgi:hypothetical protein